MNGPAIDWWLVPIQAWQWPTLWTAVSAIGTVAAFLATTVYVALTYKLVKREDIPYLQLTRQTPQTERDFVIENIGRGIGLSSALCDSDGRMIALPIGVIKPSGSFNVHTSSAIPLLPSFAFFLYYQELGGQWHATKLVPMAGRFRVQFAKISDDEVPKSVKADAQVMSAWEFMHRKR